MKGFSNARPSSCVRAVALPNAAALHVDGRDRAPRPGVDSKRSSGHPVHVLPWQPHHPDGHRSEWPGRRNATGLRARLRAAPPQRAGVLGDQPREARERKRLYDRRRFTAGRQDWRASRGPFLSRWTLRHRRRERGGGTADRAGMAGGRGRRHRGAPADVRLLHARRLAAARRGASDRYPKGRQRGDRLQRAERRRHSRCGRRHLDGCLTGSADGERLRWADREQPRGRRAVAQPSGLARFCTLLAMHYTSTATTSEVVREVRSWLTATPASHAFMQCEAIRTFENDTSGLFLTTAGLVDDGLALTAPAVRVPSHPLAQIDGTFQADSGAVDSIGLQSGSIFKTGVQTIINENSAPLTSRIALLTGPLDGASGNAEVTYLAGHDYSVDLPISTNPQTNGVRLFLNSLFESRCATDTPEAGVALTMSAPALVHSSTITYTIDYSNPGFRPVENVRLTDTLPAGTAFASATGGGSHTGGVVTWNLPPLAPGGAGSVSVTVTVAADGAYTNSARMWFSQLVVKAITSNSVTTVRDTVAPTVNIPVPPNVTATSDTTPSFVFTVVDAGAVATTCRIDGDPFAPCASPFTAASPL